MKCKFIRWLAIAVLVACGGITGSGVSWLAHAATPLKSAAAPNQLASLAPVIPRAIGDQCVADTDIMRSDHMTLLNHQRDETVIEGKRDNPFSLVGCVNCHAQTAADGSPVRIDAEGQFCESCHSFAAVKIDCFTCHAAVPEQGKLIGLHNTAQSLLAEFTTASMLPAGLQIPVKLSVPHKTHGNKNANVTAD